jgi:predicted DsbA family dithiol-disulfide isomerase
MKIEVWSDFVCPFCYIGKRRLEEALALVSFRDQIEVEFKSFELDPNAAKYNGKSIHEVLASKYGMSLEQAKQANKSVGQQATTVGLTYQFDSMKPTNTFDAHRLTKFAKTRKKESMITENLLYAYFTKSMDLGDLETLADIAEEAGINREETLAVLNDPMAFTNEVRLDEMEAQQYGISGVPYFVINQKYAISGAQPTSTFSNALKQVWDEETAAPKLMNLSVDHSENASCTDESCIIPEKKKE